MPISKKQNQSDKIHQTEIQRKAENILDYTISETQYKIENANNLFSIHKDQKFPVFWDLENATVVNLLVELKNNYIYKNNPIYKKLIDDN